MTEEQYIERKMRSLRCVCGGENTKKGRASVECTSCGKDNSMEYVFVYDILSAEYKRKFND